MTPSDGSVYRCSFPGYHTAYSYALSPFHQGRQTDGSPRRPKFNINKKVLANDNFVVFRHTFHKQ